MNYFQKYGKLLGMQKFTNMGLRILAICGTIALAIATVLNIIIGTHFVGSLLYPYTETITPLLNGFCTVLGFISIFRPNNKYIFPTILVIEAVYNVICGFEVLGIFLYSFCMLLLFSRGYFRTHTKIKLLCISILWLLVLTTLFSFCWNDFVFAVGVSLFAAASYFALYSILYDQLNFLLSNVTMPSDKTGIALPQKGSVLNLKILNLTKRQTACIHYTMNTDKSYKKIADELFISESAIKKDMQDLFHLFGVKNREMLRLLLLQYKIEI